MPYLILESQLVMHFILHIMGRDGLLLFCLHFLCSVVFFYYHLKLLLFMIIYVRNLGFTVNASEISLILIKIF